MAPNQVNVGIVKFLLSLRSLSVSHSGRWFFFKVGAKHHFRNYAHLLFPYRQHFVDKRTLLVIILN